MAPSSQASRRALRKKCSSEKSRLEDITNCSSKPAAQPDDKTPNAASAAAGHVRDQEFAKRCEVLRSYYATVDRAEWWWLMDPSLEAIGAQLQHQGYAVLDSFLGPSQASRLRDEVKACHREGRLETAGLIDATTEDSGSQYINTTTRGDLVGWFNSENDWPHGRELDAHLTKLGTLVSELSTPCPELAKISGRSFAMVACYPGGGAHYIKHVDNDGKHPQCRRRILTALIYLNEGWKPGDGGELAIYCEDNEEQERCVVEPLFNRLLIFWSDGRTPHEVRPANFMRYSITLWLLGDRNTETVRNFREKPLPPPDTAILSEPKGRLQTEDDALADTPSGHVEQASSSLESCSTDAHCNRQNHIDCTYQGRCGIHYSWLRNGCHIDGFSGVRQPCELHVEFHDGAATPSCPAMEISETQVRVASVGRDDNLEPLLCLPLPFPNEPSSASSAPRWSQRKRRLTVEFTPSDASVSMSTLAANLAEQLQQNGWGVLDSFLPGPDADALRSFIVAERAAGHLRVGSNSHEGPVGTAMKNDEYRFMDLSHQAVGAAAPNACARRINLLMVDLMRNHKITGLAGIPISQGSPMIAVYPGNGSAYGRHFDATDEGRGNNGRILTVLVYLNPFWREADGGCLRLLRDMDDDRGTDIEPLHGRLVAFLCKNRCPHEVLPSQAERVAATFWYYDSARLSDRCKPGQEVAGGFGYEAD